MKSGKTFRGEQAHLSEAAEKSNQQTVQGITSALLKNKEKMGRQAESQLKSLFKNTGESYGRARAVGTTAADASDVFARAATPPA